MLPCSCVFPRTGQFWGAQNSWYTYSQHRLYLNLPLFVTPLAKFCEVTHVICPTKWVLKKSCLSYRESFLGERYRPCEGDWGNTPAPEGQTHQTDGVNQSQLFPAMNWSLRGLCGAQFSEDWSVTMQFYSDFTLHLNQETILLSQEETRVFELPLQTLADQKRHDHIVKPYKP